MHFSNLISSALLFSVASASDCNNPSNFPSFLSASSFDLVTKSATSPDNSLTTAISGKILVVSPCSLQLVGLTLSGAPITAGIQLYGQSATQSFPLSTTVLSGTYNNQPGPVITFSDTTVFQISPSSPGIAWSDFLSIKVYSVPQKWVIAEAVISKGSASTGPTTSTPAASTASGSTSQTQIPVKPLSAKSSSITLAIIGSTLFFVVIMSYIL